MHLRGCKAQSPARWYCDVGTSQGCLFRGNGLFASPLRSTRLAGGKACTNAGRCHHSRKRRPDGSEHQEVPVVEQGHAGHQRPTSPGPCFWCVSCSAATPSFDPHRSLVSRSPWALWRYQRREYCSAACTNSSLMALRILAGDRTSTCVPNPSSHQCKRSSSSTVAITSRRPPDSTSAIR